MQNNTHRTLHVAVLGLAAWLVLATGPPVSAAEGVVVNVCWGGDDSMSCPAETAVSDTALSALVLSQYAGSDCFGMLDFDEVPSTNDCVGDSLPSNALFLQRLTFEVPVGGWTGGTLTFRAKAGTSIRVATDFIAFFEGSSYITGALLQSLAGASGNWTPHQAGVFSLNLSNLPQSFDARSVLQYLNDGDLDVMIGNETGVDWICLTSCACDCHGDPSGCNGVLDITDVVQIINVSFRGSTALPDPNPSCPAEMTDLNCSGSTDVVDVVKIVNVAFRGANPATEFCDPCP